MKINPDPLVIKNADQTFSKSGSKDFVDPEPEDVRTIGPMQPPPRPRTRSSVNNSYS